MSSTSYIQTQLAQLTQLRERKKTAEGIKQAQHLLAHIQDQPNYLDVLTDAYAEAGRLLVRLHYLDNKPEDAMQVGERLLADLERREGNVEDENLAKLLSVTAGQLGILGRLEQALSYLHRAYVILERCDGSVEEKWKIANNLGFVYSKSENFEESAVWYKKVLKTHIELDNLEGILVAYGNLVANYRLLEQLDESIRYGNDGVAVIQQAESSQHDPLPSHTYLLIGFLYNNVGHTWFEKGEFEQARHYLKRADSLFREHDYMESSAYCDMLLGLGKLAMREEAYPTSIDYFTRSLQIAEQLDMPHNIYDCCVQLAEAHNLNGNHQLAFQYYQRYHKTYMLVFDEKKQRSLEQLEVKHRTEVVQIEAAQMRRENEVLEQLVSERTIGLQQSLEREAKLSIRLQDALRVTEQINTVRGDMLNTIAHEFRTPLTIINTSANLLKNFYDRLPIEKRNNYLSNIEQSVNELQGMLSNAIEVDRFKVRGVGTAEYHPSFAKLCAEVESALQAQHTSRLIIACDGDAKQTVAIDTTLLIQGIMPLVDNALTYSDDEVVVNIVLAKDNALKVMVEDRGMGMMAEEIPHIFDLFYRSPRAQFLRGLGLGLYTAQHVVQLLGGTITAASDGADRGAMFTVSI